MAALYPRYPLNTTDNRYHLQAFRHLYVLAVQPRCVEAIDVDTGSSCYVPLQVTLKVPLLVSVMRQSCLLKCFSCLEGDGYVPRDSPELCDPLSLVIL